MVKVQGTVKKHFLDAYQCTFLTRMGYECTMSRDDIDQPGCVGVKSQVHLILTTKMSSAYAPLLTRYTLDFYVLRSCAYLYKSNKHRLVPCH